MTNLKRTPLHAQYEEWGAKTVDFGGWDLPVQFTSIKEEHHATREKAGLFDVSHMGELLVEGPGSEAYLQKMLTNDVTKLTPNRAQYTILCYEDGGTVDDLLVYKLKEESYLLVVNAANTQKDYEWLNQHLTEEATLTDVSDQYVQLALQGPKAEMILQRLTESDLSEIKFFRFMQDVSFKGIEHKAIVSRTGYTGEDGFEIYVHPEAGGKLWQTILQEGKEDGLMPVGLGARDTLRFEAKLPLYGQELSADISPVEAGLGFAVKADKDTDFIGKEVLKKQKEEGTNRKLVGIEMIDKGIPRHGYKVFDGDEEVGFVTTGTQSPTLEKNIGLAVVPVKYTEEGTELLVQVRKRFLKAKVIPTPFYKR